MHNGTCSKCGSTQVLRIPGKIGAYGSGNNIQLGWTIFSAIPVARYLCTRCGFLEEWVDDAQDLARLAERGVPPAGDEAEAAGGVAVDRSLAEVTPLPRSNGTPESTEAVTCLYCGETIPAGATICRCCGWSYL